MHSTQHTASVNISFSLRSFFQVLGSTIPRQDSIGAESWWENQEEDIFKWDDIDGSNPTLGLHVCLSPLISCRWVLDGGPAFYIKQLEGRHALESLLIQPSNPGLRSKDHPEWPAVNPTICPWRQIGKTPDIATATSCSSITATRNLSFLLTTWS